MCQNMSSWSSVGRLKFLELLSQWWFKPRDFFGITEDRKFKELKLDSLSLKWLEHLLLMDGTTANNLLCLSSLEPSVLAKAIVIAHLLLLLDVVI